jgi:hypothetical protein
VVEDWHQAQSARSDERPPLPHCHLRLIDSEAGFWINRAGVDPEPRRVPQPVT